MSRIIESCFQCSNRHLSGKGMYVCHFDTYRPKFLADYASELKTIPDSCPLPKLEDKLREAWKASTHATGSDMNAYDEWRKQK